MKTRTLSVPVLLALATFVPLVPFAPTGAATVGDLAGDLTVPVPSSIGVSIDFDGTNFWYTNYYGDELRSFTVSCAGGPPAVCAPTLTSTVTVTDAASGFSVHVDAMAWDAGRGKLWAGSSDYGAYLIDTTTGVGTRYFTAAPSCNQYNLVDGLAYDGADDTIWWSADVTQSICHYDLAGNLLETIASSTLPGSPGCGVSGLAVGGDYLYIGFNGCGTILRMNKADHADAQTFAHPGGRDEDMTCDTATFPGKSVIWSKDAYNNHAYAFEIEAGTCGVGGFPDAGATADGTALVALVTHSDVPFPIGTDGLGHARASNGASEEDAAAEVSPAGVATASALTAEADSTFDGSGAVPSSSATAKATVLELDVPGVLTADLVQSVSSSAADESGAFSSDAGSRIVGLSIMGGPSIDVPYPEPQDITLPDGLGVVHLFERAATGGATRSELTVTAIRVELTLDDATVLVVVSRAYSGASTEGALAPPQQPQGIVRPTPDDAQAAVDDVLDDLPPLPGSPGSGPSGTRIPATPCPQACYGPLPGDSVSQSAGPVSVTRSRYAYDGGPDYGYAFGTTSVSVAGVGSIGLSEYVYHSGYHYECCGDYSSDSSNDYVTLGLTVDTVAGSAWGGLSRSTYSTKAEQPSVGYLYENRWDAPDVYATYSGPLGYVSVHGYTSQSDYVYEYGGQTYAAYGERYGYVQVYAYSYATGSEAFLALQFDYVNNELAGPPTLTVTGYVDGESVSETVPLPAPLP